MTVFITINKAANFSLSVVALLKALKYCEISWLPSVSMTEQSQCDEPEVQWWKHSDSRNALIQTFFLVNVVSMRRLNTDRTRGTVQMLSFEKVNNTCAWRMAGLELLSDQGFRIDGRKPTELRRIQCRLGVFSQADGSAYIEQGNTKVLAAVYGPHEVTE